MIEKLEKVIQEDRESLETTCLVLTLKRERHRFLDGYELALSDMCREIGRGM
jgi:hypothetical protein